MSTFSNYKLFEGISVRNSDNKLLVIDTDNTNNFSLHSSDGSDTNVDTLSIKKIMNKNNTDGLEICNYDGSTVSPLIKIKDSDCRIMTNLNVNGNINLTDGGMVKTTGIGSFGSINCGVGTFGTITLANGSITDSNGAISFGNNKITSVSNPTTGTDVATKTYVDSTYTAGTGLAKSGTQFKLNIEDGGDTDSKGMFMHKLGTYSGPTHNYLWFNTESYLDDPAVYYLPGPSSISDANENDFNTQATSANAPSSMIGYFLKSNHSGSVTYINSPYGFTNTYISHISISFRNIVKFRFKSDGTSETTTGTSLTTEVSDDRLKVNEEHLPFVTPLIKQLNPQKYKKHILDSLYDKENPTPFKDRLSESLIDEFGLIAQEVYTIPEFRILVKPPSDSDMDKIKNTVIYTDLNEPDNYYENQGWGTIEPATINYIGFIPILIKGFNEQQKEIDTLKTENQQQQTKINELTSIIDKLKTANSFEEFKNSL